MSSPRSSPSTGAGLDPVRGTAEEILELLRDWDAAHDPAPLVVETSGSTGRAKRVLLSRAAMRASADATSDRLGGPGQWLLTLPPAYVAGLQVLFRSVRSCTEPVIVGQGLGDSAVTMTGRRRYTSLVPTQLHRMLEAVHTSDALTRFDAVLVGGAPLDPDLGARAEAAGATVVTTYGMSETCGGCVYDGFPLDGVQVRTTADGRLGIRGPVLFDGYDGQPGLTAEVMRDGWFVTRDLGRVSRSGRVTVGGRVDDVVSTGGVKVPVGTVAARLRLHPAVRGAELVGVPDDEWGMVVVAVADTDLTLEQLRDWVAEEFPRSFAPRRVVHVDALPLLPNGKLDRLAVQRLASTRRGARHGEGPSTGRRW